MPSDAKYTKGTTLFEVLLYIALFTVVSTSCVWLHISFIKTADIQGLASQKAEIGIFMHLLVEHQLDAGEALDLDALRIGIEKILRFYPNFSLGPIEARYIDSESGAQIVHAAYLANKNRTLGVTYQLTSKNPHRIFSNVLYFELI